jgi:hypothetical protein
MTHIRTEVTGAAVQLWSARGVPHTEMARRLRIAIETLYAHYRDDIDAGLHGANEEVAGVMYQSAIAGDVKAMAYWLSRRAGWRESQSLELSGPGGGPIAIKQIELVVVDPTRASTSTNTSSSDDGDDGDE